jgi:hypothetical protein
MVLAWCWNGVKMVLGWCGMMVSGHPHHRRQYRRQQRTQYPKRAQRQRSLPLCYIMLCSNLILCLPCSILFCGDSTEGSSGGDTGGRGHFSYSTLRCALPLPCSLFFCFYAVCSCPALCSVLNLYYALLLFFGVLCSTSMLYTQVEVTEAPTEEVAAEVEAE